MRVAYLVNKYPAASHSFIRREIRAVEAQGTDIVRFTVRYPKLVELPDPRDREELAKTTALLHHGVIRLLFAAFKAVLLHPVSGLRGLLIAFSKGAFHPKELVRRTAYFAEAAVLAEHISARRIDHIHAHFGTNPATVARIASTIAGVSYSFTVHGPDEFDAPRQLDLAGKIADCAFCVAISSFGRSQLMRWSDFAHWPKIAVVRCGVDDSFLNDIGDGSMPEAPRLCTVARLSAQKGVPLLLAAAVLLKDRRLDFRLTIVGDGEMRHEIEAQIELHGLGDHVTLAGWASSDAVVAHLREARAMVLPSFAEGLPVVIMEALALGRPVITTSIAGIPELVDGACGWLVPAGSIEKLAQAMAEALAASPANLSEMGQVGRQRVVQLHDASLNGAELNDLFRTACSDRD